MTVVFPGCSKEEEIAATDNISPVIDQEGADPYVLKYDDVYYYTKTTATNIVLFRSSNLTGIAAGEQCIIYEPPFELVDLWAPELFCLVRMGGI